MTENSIDHNIMPTNERPVRQGGLMRCCLATLAEETAPSTIGSVLSCKHEEDTENKNMIVAPDGVWEWNRPLSDKELTDWYQQAHEEEES